MREVKVIMLTMNNKEKILISNTNFLNNYDKENFISASNNALNMGNYISLIDGKSISDQFEFLKASLNKIQIPFSHDLIIYFNNISCLERINNWSYKMVSVLNLNNDIIIKPKYLLDASNKIKDAVNQIISGKIDYREFYAKYHATIDLYSSVLKQQVIDGINEYDNAESLFNKKYMDIEDNSLIVSVNYDCIKNEIIPFINNFQNTKTVISSDIDKVSSIVKEVLDNINLTITTINKNSSTMNNDTFKLVSNYVYNYIRSIIDVTYTVLYILSSKCYSLENIVCSITELYGLVKNEFSTSNVLVESGIFDNTVTESESKKISDRLLNGNTDIFTETVTDIMSCHSNHILSEVYKDEIPEIDINQFVDVISNRYSYDESTFESVNEIYDNILHGLDIIENGLDSDFIVVSNLIKESGFNQSLNDRYGYITEMVSDVSEYSDNTTPDTYFNIIGEISNYSKNIGLIAESASDVITKISNIKESIGKIEDSFVKDELSMIIESVENQFIFINKDISTNSYRRLKNLAEKADYVLYGTFESVDYPEIIIGYNNEDFYRECFLNACLEELHEDNDILMESMLKGYYSEREYLEKGIRLVFEADGNTNNTGTSQSSDAPTTSTGTQAQAKDTSTTKPSVNTNTTANVVNDQNKNNAENFKKLSLKIKKIIEKIINAFRDFVDKFKKKNLEWLNKHKTELINRSYSNVSINVLPYHTEMPETQIFNYFNTMEKNVDNVAKNIHTIKTREEMRSKLFNFGNIKFEGDNVDESKVLTNFFKVGTKPLDVVTYSNKDVKTLVVDTMIPYCEKYYNSLADEINKHSEKLVSITNKYDTVRESVMITEAETQEQNTSSSQSTNQPANNTTNTTTTNTTNNDKTNNETPKYTEQYTWLSGFVSDFVGSVCNACRARNDDYLKILAALVPKKQVFKNREGMDDNAQQTVNGDNTNK